MFGAPRGKRARASLVITVDGTGISRQTGVDTRRKHCVRAFLADPVIRLRKTTRERFQPVRGPDIATVPLISAVGRTCGPRARACPRSRGRSRAPRLRTRLICSLQRSYDHALFSYRGDLCAPARAQQERHLARGARLHSTTAAPVARGCTPTAPWLAGLMRPSDEIALSTLSTDIPANGLPGLYNWRLDGKDYSHLVRRHLARIAGAWRGTGLRPQPGTAACRRISTRSWPRALARGLHRLFSRPRSPEPRAWSDRKPGPVSPAAWAISAGGPQTPLTFAAPAMSPNSRPPHLWRENSSAATRRLQAQT